MTKLAGSPPIPIDVNEDLPLTNPASVVNVPGTARDEILTGPLNEDSHSASIPPVMKALVDVISPVTARDETLTAPFMTDSRATSTPPAINALVEVNVPTDVMLPTRSPPAMKTFPKRAFSADMGLVDVIVPTTEREDICTLWRKTEGRETATPPDVSALVDVRVPAAVMLATTTGPLTKIELKIPSPPMIVFVEVRVPVTAIDDPSTISVNVDGRNDSIDPGRNGLELVRVPRKVKLEANTSPLITSERNTPLSPDTVSVEVILPVTVSESICTSLKNSEYRNERTDRATSALVEVMVPRAAMLDILRAPSRSRAPNVPVRPASGLVDTMLPIAVMDATRVNSSSDGPEERSPPTERALVDVRVPRIVVLGIETSPLRKRVLKIPRFPRIGLVDVMLPSTDSDDILTLCRNKEEFDASISPKTAGLVDVMLPTADACPVRITLRCVSDVKYAGPPVIGPVEVTDPVTEREEISTTWLNVDGREDWIAPEIKALVDVKVPRNVTLPRSRVPTLTDRNTAAPAITEPVEVMLPVMEADPASTEFENEEGRAEIHEEAMMELVEVTVPRIAALLNWTFPAESVLRVPVFPVRALVE